MFTACLSVATLLLALPSAEPQQTFSEVDVPYMLRLKGGTGTIRFAYQEGRLRSIAADRKIVIAWVASPSSNQAPDWSLQWNPATNAIGNHQSRSGDQEISTRFYPTASCAVDSHTILVAGATSAGATVIDRLTLQWPDPMPGPVVHPTTGIKSVQVGLPSVSQTQRLYSESTQGRYLVKNLCAIRSGTGAPTSALVQFHDSNDVYAISLSTGSLSLLASATTAAGSLGAVSALNPKDHHGIRFGNHSTAGFVYVFERGFKLLPAPGASGAPPVLVLVDAGRDGTIESHMLLSEADYRSQGWHDLSNYTQWWLN